jgi:hypothetical protein
VLNKISQDFVDSYFNGDKPWGPSGWSIGYTLITLGEYYLLTKDEKVIPTMKILALALARGQDAAGLWGHKLSRSELNRAPGYGVMNQPSITNLIGLIFAKKCGIKEPKVIEALDKTYAWYSEFIGRGATPYGAHRPNSKGFNNNGTSGSLAVMFSLMNNKEGTSFFSQMSATTYDSLTSGHASSFFNPLWTPLGASLSGPEVTQQFFKRIQWYHTGERHWKGGFLRKDSPGHVAGQVLLTYCLPRKALLITGREADESIWVKGDEATKVILRSKVTYEKKSIEELLLLMQSRFPAVREKAVGQMTKLSDRHGEKCTLKILEFYKKGNIQDKITALGYFKGRCNPEVAMANEKWLVSIVKDEKENIKVRVAAAESLLGWGFKNSGYKYFEDYLKLTHAKRSKPDPFGYVDISISRVIGQVMKGAEKNNNLARKKDKSFKAKPLTSDKELIYKTALKFLDHKRQDVRGNGINLLKSISIEDFYIVGDKLMHVLHNRDKGYHSYSGTLNSTGIGILADLNIEEGLGMLEYGIFKGGGKWSFKYTALMRALPKYGKNAEPYLAKFEAHRSINKPGDRFTPAWQATVKKIKDSKVTKKLMSAKEAIEYGKGKK